MKRNMLKAIDDYKHEFWEKRNGREGVFYLDEIMQIKKGDKLSKYGKIILNRIQ